MAFLCPVRIRSQKSRKKKEPRSSNLDPILQNKDDFQVGRITGSSSIETLVRVGLEKGQQGPATQQQNFPEKLFLVLHDFTPCVDDELEVKRGDVVQLLYREHDWAYVISDNNKEGFIPFSYLDSSLSEKSDQIHQEETTSQGSSSADAFLKTPHERHIVLYSFQARDENDLSVERGELLTVLNKDDENWYWVIRSSDAQEGFVPSAFVFPFSYVNSQQKKKEVENNDNCVEGSELVMLYDYRAQAPDDLSVKRGDWVYADLNHQTVEGWLWAFAPKQKKYGFIPKAYARPPAMTSL